MVEKASIMAAATEHGNRHLVNIQNKQLAMQDGNQAKIGTRSGIRHDAELHIFRLRGWGRFRVHLCDGRLGQDLFDGLRTAGMECGFLFPILRVPVCLCVTMCMSFALGTFGWPDLSQPPKHVLLLQDFASVDTDVLQKFACPQVENLNR